MLKKITTHIQLNIQIITMAFFWGIVTITTIHAESSWQTTLNSAYKLLDNYDFIIAPTANTLSGFTLCGPCCALGGAILGTTDEILLRHKYTNTHHLSNGFLGAATGNMIHAGIPSIILGIVGTTILTSGKLNGHTELVAPTISTFASSIAFGKQGAIIGGIIGIIDELLIANNITNKHSLTCINLGVTSTHLYFQPNMAFLIGVPLGLVIANYEQKLTDDIAAPLQEIAQLKTIYSKFIPKEQLNAHFENQMISLAAGQLMAQTSLLKRIKYHDPLNKAFENADTKWNNIQEQSIMIIVWLCPQLSSRLITNIIDNYFNKNLHRKLHDKIYAAIYLGPNALQMRNHTNYTQITDNLDDTISTLVFQGNQLYTDAFIRAAMGSYAVGTIMSTFPNMAIYSTIYNQLKLSITQWFALQEGACQEKLIALDTDIKSLKKDIRDNFVTISERNGINSTWQRIHNLEIERGKETNAKVLLENAELVWRVLTDVTNFVFDKTYIGQQVSLGNINFADRTKVLLAGAQISHALSYAGDFAQSTNAVKRARERLKQLIPLLEAPTSGDDITRAHNPEKQLTFHDISIYVNNELLLKIDDLRLATGKAYAVIGKSGCGKSALMSKIAGIKTNGFTGNGTIYYPLVPHDKIKIVMLGNDYLPPDLSLKETLLFPDSVTDDFQLQEKQHKQIVNLLEEMDLANFIPLLDTKEEWRHLSGGEMKKMQLISAIIKNPDILILDEMFSRLDASSIQIIQYILTTVLKKHLPHSLILVVDHHATTNNYGDFYDQYLHIENKTILLKSFTDPGPTLELQER